MSQNPFASDIESAVADTSVDMTKAASGGGYTPPAAGPCRLRLVGYVEIGKHEKNIPGKPTQVKDEVILTFEVSGPNHKPVDGRPYLVDVRLPYSLNEKANLYKLFQVMNYSGKFKHFAQMLGEAFKGELVHREYTTGGGKKGVAVELRDKVRGFLIQPPRREDEDGNIVPIKVDPATTPFRCLIWAKPTKAMWDSLFIDGQWDAVIEDGKEVRPARSKNVIQNLIRSALNFKGSPVHALLSGSEDVDLPDAETPPKVGGADLADVLDD